MTRPKIARRIRFRPRCSCFKPQGLSKKGLCGVDLEKDEFEALRLHNVNGLDQNQAAQKMRISQPTFARILSSAQKKVAEALVRGEEIRIK